MGYISYGGQETLETEMYYLAQYALAPLVIDRSANHPIVVGNFPGPSPLADQFPPLGLAIKADLGHGVFLLGKDDR